MIGALTVIIEVHAAHTDFGESAVTDDAIANVAAALGRDLHAEATLTVREIAVPNVDILNTARHFRAERHAPTAGAVKNADILDRTADLVALGILAAFDRD